LANLKGIALYVNRTGSMLCDLYSSYFKLQVCWLCSLTRITYYSKLIGIRSLAAFLQLELLGYRLASTRRKAENEKHLSPLNQDANT